MKTINVSIFLYRKKHKIHVSLINSSIKGFQNSHYLVPINPVFFALSFFWVTPPGKIFLAIYIVVDQRISNYTCRRISLRWSMVVFFNMVDYLARSESMMEYWKKHVWRLMLEELRKSLTNCHNQWRTKQHRLSAKVKLPLQSLGYELKPESSIAQDDIDNFIKIKRRCFLCPSHRGRKVRQTCDTCQNNVCNSHSVSTTSMICQSCKKNTSLTWRLINWKTKEIQIRRTKIKMQIGKKKLNWNNKGKQTEYNIR